MPSEYVERLNTALTGRYRIDRELGQGGMGDGRRSSWSGAARAKEAERASLAAPVRVVVNWFEELRQRMSVG